MASTDIALAYPILKNQYEISKKKFESIHKNIKVFLTVNPNRHGNPEPLFLIHLCKRNG